jgi:tRNA (guanine-N7-)-methyltransferase
MRFISDNVELCNPIFQGYPMHRTIKSFVLRTGRVSPRQQIALNEWLPNYELPSPENKWDLSDLFRRTADTVVEIGFGMGGSLIAMAKAAPEINFIGIEVHRAGIGSLVADLHDEQITNVRVAPFDAVEVFKRSIGDNSLAGVQIFFPDPWPKKRHQKRRLIQSEFIHELLKKIKVGGFIHCATDWEDYAEQMLTVLSAETMLSNTHPDSGFTPRPERRPLTKFEQRGNQLGHGVWDLMFVRI